MTRLVFAPGADLDLRDIAEFTSDKFGARQSRIYTGRLRSRIEKALEIRALLRPRPELGDGLMSILAESHVVYGRFDNGAFVVIAILHGSMDPARRFGNDD